MQTAAFIDDVKTESFRGPLSTEADLPGECAVKYGDKKCLGRVERGEEVRQKQRRSRQEHEARRPGDAQQEEQCQGAHGPRSGETTENYERS